MRTLALLALSGCTVTVPFPNLVVLGNDWTMDEKAVIVDAAFQWQMIGADLKVGFVKGPVPVGCTDLYCPVFPRAMTGRAGRTNQDGVALDATFLEGFYGMRGLRRAAMHEFGHVVGLGPPANEAEHIQVVGDIMCSPLECLLMRDDGLSELDALAWRNR